MLKRKGRDGRVGRETGAVSTAESYRCNGWIPADTMSCSQTLEYAYNDYCAATMAKGLGKSDDAEKYLIRSAQWANSVERRCDE